MSIICNMRNSKASKNQSFIDQSIELSTAVPEIVAHRMNEFLNAGVQPSPETQREFMLMWEEKITAFSESWHAAAQETIKINQQLTESLIHHIFTPWWSISSEHHLTPAKINTATQSILDKSMEPIHKQAISNARRINKLK